MIELGNQTVEVSDQCEQLIETTRQMGGLTEKVNTAIQPFYNLQSELDQSINMVHKLNKYPVFHRDERTLFMYISWINIVYQNWITDIGSMIAAGEVHAIELDIKKSTFGRVYPVFEPNEEEAKPIWKKIGEDYKKCYELGKKVYSAVEKGNISEAQRIHDEMKKYGQQCENDIQQVLKIRVKSDFSELGKQMRTLLK